MPVTCRMFCSVAVGKEPSILPNVGFKKSSTATFIRKSLFQLINIHLPLPSFMILEGSVSGQCNRSGHTEAFFWIIAPFFYVLEGTAVVEIDDEKKEVGKDTLVNSPAKIPHCWYNKSGSDLRFLVVKVPHPTESTKLL